MDRLKVFICLSLEIFALKFEVTILMYRDQLSLLSSLTPKQDELETQLIGFIVYCDESDWSNEWYF